MFLRRHFSCSARHLRRAPGRARRRGASVTKVEMIFGSVSPISRRVSSTSSGVLNIRWLRPMASTPSSSATSTIWSSASRLSAATVVLMLTRSGAPVRRAASCSRRRPAAVRSNVPCLAARPVVQLAGAVDRHRDVLQEALLSELGQRLGPLVGDDGAVGRQVAAGVALLAEEIEDPEDVLPHEDLAAREAHLEPRLVGERARASASSGSSWRHSPSMFSRSPT